MSVDMTDSDEQHDVNGETRTAGDEAMPSTCTPERPFPRNIARLIPGTVF